MNQLELILLDDFSRSMESAIILSCHLLQVSARRVYCALLANLPIAIDRTDSFAFGCVSASCKKATANECPSKLEFGSVKLANWSQGERTQSAFPRASADSARCFPQPLPTVRRSNSSKANHNFDLCARRRLAKSSLVYQWASWLVRQFASLPIRCSPQWQLSARTIL